MTSKRIGASPVVHGGEDVNSRTHAGGVHSVYAPLVLIQARRQAARHWIKINRLGLNVPGRQGLIDLESRRRTP